MKLCLQLFVAFIAIVAVAQCQSETCKQIGEPCNVSTECCSKACLFYAHKCVTSRPLGPNGIKTKTADKQSNQNEVIQKLDKQTRKVEPFSNLKADCGRHGDPCVSEEECCAGLRCHKYAKRCQVILPKSELKELADKLVFKN
uniref:Putative omega-conotoxin-like protein 1 n=1 Tax=Xenopsylla cheopis TaxID=163159 RepID=A0A6M2E1N9_XENCH